jgi:glutamyl/glutaminyl-tRNA synthetase
MLALLGWNPGTEQELFSMEELIEAFSIERVGKSGSRFDPEKAKWFNHQYLQKKSNEQLAIEFREFLRARGYFVDIVELETLIGLVKERVSFVKDIWDQTDFFFKAPDTYDPEVIKKRWKEDSPALLLELRDQLEKMEDFSAAATESVVKAWIEKNGYNTGAVMNTFRLVIVGTSRGPHMFDIIEWIGKEETIRRIEKGLSVIGK